jgi:hypothetical protein
MLANAGLRYPRFALPKLRRQNQVQHRLMSETRKGNGFSESQFLNNSLKSWQTELVGLLMIQSFVRLGSPRFKKWAIAFRLGMHFINGSQTARGIRRREPLGCPVRRLVHWLLSPVCFLSRAWRCWLRFEEAIPLLNRKLVSQMGVTIATFIGREGKTAYHPGTKWILVRVNFC